MRKRIIRLLATTLVATLALGGAEAVQKPVEAFEAVNLDVRNGSKAIRPTSAQLGALRTLQRDLAGVKLEWNFRFGTPATVLRYGHPMTPANPAAQPHDVAREWLASRATLFGWTAADVANLTTEKTLRQPNGGPVAVLLHQTYGGLHGGSFGGSILVSLDASNRVLMVRANVVRTPKLANGRRLSAPAAVAIAAGIPQAPKIDGHVAGWTRFDRAGFGGPHYAKLSAFPLAGGEVRPVHEVLFIERVDSGWRIAVDALDGRVLYRRQIASNAAPEGRIFRNYPGAPRGGSHEMTSFRGDPHASPAGWLSPKADDHRLPTTFGNNANAATHWGSFISPDGPGQLRPVAPTGSFDEQFNDAWKESQCGYVEQADTDDETLEDAAGQAAGHVEPAFMLDAMPAAVNLFYHHNLMHDFWYKLGFDEPAGNMQVNNFGKAGMDGDAIWGLVQNGAANSRNNAYMLTLPDGVPSWSGMFVWEPVPALPNIPCVDGDFDAAVIYHEYTHAVSNRWVGSEWGNLGTAQGGAMGESWSDFFALHYLYEAGLENRDVLGAFVTGDASTGIRNWALGSVAAHYGDFGYDGGPAVHSDGEIWSGLQWDLRTTLGKLRGAGTKYAAQIIADAMPISGPSPTFLDMRDAILAADLARTNGRFQSVIWSVFARRGMGASAKSPGIDGAEPSENTTPQAAFDVLDKRRNGRVNLSVVDPISGKPLWGAEVLAGTVERSTPLAVVPANGRVSLYLAGGPLTLTVRLRGYGSRAVTVRAVPGKSASTRIALEPNYASSATGAKITSSAENAESLHAAIDDSRFSAARIPVEGATLTIALAGTSPVVVNEVRVAAGSGRGALADFQVLTSADGRTFRPFVSSRLGFPKPFAVAEHALAYRSYRSATGVTATHVRLVAKSPQIHNASHIAIGDVQVFGAGDRYAVSVTKDVVFTDKGTMTLTLPMTPEDLLLGSPIVASPTEMLMRENCEIPPTQGMEAWVSTLPPEFGDGGSTIRVQADVDQVEGTLPEIDVYFLDGNCERLGYLAAPDPLPFEQGIIPSGTKYVLTLNFIGGPTSITVSAKLPGRRVVRIGSAPRGTKY